MSERAWIVRTAGQEIAVEDDQLRISSTPRQRLAGHRVSFRSGSLPDRVGAAARAGWLLSSFPIALLAIAYYFYAVLEIGLTATGILSIATLLMMLYSFKSALHRERTIDRSDVESVTFDEDDRTLSIEHRTREWFQRTLDRQRRTRTFRFETIGDLRDARERFRLAGVPIDQQNTDERSPDGEFDDRSGWNRDDDRLQEFDR